MIPLLVLAVLAADPAPLQLEQLVAAAREQDPRRQELALREGVAARRLANLDVRLRPDLALQGQAAYHSEVASLPAGLALGPPREQVTLAVDAAQLLWDGGRVRQQQAIEEAARDLDQQGVAVDFVALRRRLEGAFFAVLLSQAELELLATLEADLAAQLARLEARVAAGTALPGDAAVLAAELEVQRQRAVQVDGERRAALDVLAVLSGLELGEGVELAVPAPVPPADLHAAARAAAEGAGVGRPELVQLARGRQLLAAQRAFTGLAQKPTLSAFAQGGVGRPPDQNFFERDVTPFVQLGLRLRWQPLDWGVARREGEIHALEQEVSLAREQAFLQALSASLQQLARRIEATRAVLAADPRIVELRAVSRRQAEAQLREGVITPADYLTERNAEHRARLTAEQHRLQLARDTVDFLTTLGATP